MTAFLQSLGDELESIRAASLWKVEREILSSQSAAYRRGGRARGSELLRQQLSRVWPIIRHSLLPPRKRWTATASAWPRCASSAAPPTCTRQLEARIADYLGMEDCILFAACFDANGAVFEPLFGEQDAIISDALNHASIIDGIRLSKAKRYRYANNDMNDLEAQLKEAKAAKRAAHRDRDRRRVFDGWLSCQSQVHPRAGRQI